MEEPLSLTDCKSQTADEMKRAVSGLKANPQVAVCREKVKLYPDLAEKIEQQFSNIEHKAEGALKEALDELELVVGGKKEPESDEGENTLEESDEKIPWLVRSLRSIHTTPAEASETNKAAEHILGRKGTKKMQEITGSQLNALLVLRRARMIDERTYRRALASLLLAHTFETRQEAICNLKAELPPLAGGA